MPQTIVRVDPNDPKSIDAALRTEWLLTNGLGGYAMGTVLGANTRRYHGLLIAATKPPVGRVVALHSLIEEVVVPRGHAGSDAYSLSTQCFGHEQTLHPDGWRYLTQVVIDPPSQIAWRYRVAGMEIIRRVTLQRGSHAVRVQYEFINQPAAVTLRVRPFLPLRDFHELDHQQQHDPSQPAVSVDGPAITLARGDARVRIVQSGFAVDPQWWNTFAYSRDRERGQDWTEDVWSPGRCGGQSMAAVRQSAEVMIELITVPTPDAAVLQEVDARLTRAIDITAARRSDADWNRLAVAGRQFLVGRYDAAAHGQWTASVIAGYPWFGDWGRDTMISLPGLMVCTGRLEEARLALSCYTRHLRNGLIPNLFDDYGGAAHYNTVDASLWFVNAVHALWGAQADGLRPVCPPELLDACRAIVGAYRNGTDFNIHMDQADGLIVAGDDQTQLTWMDAARDGVVFTPRCGKPVEINALWHNALMCLSEMTEDNTEGKELVALAQRVAASFRVAFWWETRQCLHDCLAPRQGEEASPAGAFLPDSRLRPNQIFAVSLRFSPLNETQQRAVVKVVGERLLTPFGLRTLDRDDPNYKPRYEGNLFERDAAYHNGTVWPWLIGPYCEALLRVEKFGDDAKRRVREITQPLIDEMSNTGGGRCVNQIAEVYDAEPPHRPSGCPAQAWSVAEVLRVRTLMLG